MTQTRKWINAPLWVNVVYTVLDRLEAWVLTPLTDLVSKRYDFLDRHCQCPQCVERKRRPWTT